jgi:hypothetical protein
MLRSTLRPDSSLSRPAFARIDESPASVVAAGGVTGLFDIVGLSRYVCRFRRVTCIRVGIHACRRSRFFWVAILVDNHISIRVVGSLLKNRAWLVIGLLWFAGMHSDFSLYLVLAPSYLAPCTDGVILC